MLRGTTVESYYEGACVYRGDGSLGYILHPEGVVRATGQGLSHEYFLKDHLGNTRVVFDATGAVVQRTDYYPFGLEHTPLAISNTNRYLYNGKELQDETFAGGVRLGWYDYGARFYDPALGRFHVIDPLADSRSWVSSYSYCQNNPIIRTDPTGALDDWYMNEKTGELYYNENLSSQTTRHNNETYTRIGGNDMFGDMGKTTEKSYNYEQSQKMSSQHNCAIVPNQQLINKEFYINYVETGPGRSIRTESGVETIINEKYSITSNNYNKMMIGYKYLTKTDIIGFIKGWVLGKFSSTERLNYEFKPSTSPNKDVKVSPLDGYVHKFFSSWKEYEKATNGNGDLLQYRKQY